MTQIHAKSMRQPQFDEGLEGYEEQSLAGYISEQFLVSVPAVRIEACAYLVVARSPLIGVGDEIPAPTHPQVFSDGLANILPLRPIGRVMPMAVPFTEPQSRVMVPSFRPIRSGQVYRITSPPALGLVVPELAEELETFFERFAQEHGFTVEKPLEIHLSRGFKAGSPGHSEGRAADIATVGGKRLLEWKQEWDRALSAAEKIADPELRAEAIANEQKRNLGYGFYKALQEHGGWRVDLKGWRPYRGVMQLFGPWTATEGPWKAMQIKDPNVYQRQRLADQQWVFQAHQDHIHVAR
jgi:hypothetical protein